MATKLLPGKKLEREIRVQGIDAPIILTITGTELSMRVAGTRLSVFSSLEHVLDSLWTPFTVKSYLMSKPFELLKTQAAKRNKRKDGD